MILLCASGTHIGVMCVLNRNNESRNVSIHFHSKITSVKWNPVAADMIACTFDKEIVKIWNIDNEGILLEMG